ncbi:MAG: hypothetical protein LUG18_05575 [Candidatus Azobacteroides sp.]|nr:hypothetical protein [Candidatus Azobacteroides sp.]
MSIYQQIFDINEQTFDKLMAGGLLKAKARRDLLMYEYYLQEKKKYGSMQAITNTADKFCVSDSLIEKVIYKIQHLCTN